MSRTADSFLALLAALALAGCGAADARTGQDGLPPLNRVEPPAEQNAAAATADASWAAILEEFAEAARNCKLPGATLTREGAEHRLNLPPAVYAAREAAPANGRIHCLTHWGLERGMDLIVTEARN